MKGEHAELFTFNLNVGLLSRKHKNGELTPFGAPRYQSARGEYLPSVILPWEYNGEIIVLDVAHNSDAYVLTVRKHEGPLAAELTDAVARHASFELDGNGTSTRRVERRLIDEALNEIVSAVRRLPRQSMSSGKSREAPS